MKSLLAVFLASLSLSVAAQAPQPPEIAARSYLLIDVTANQVLAAKDEQAPVEPASLTKLMTGYLVFEAIKSKKLDLKQTFPVSDRAWKMAGPRMFISPTMQVPVNDLLLGMIVQNGNDATIALAEGLGGTAEKFVQMMNAQAQALGMKNTVFKNPEGSPEAGHSSTARDLSILANRILADFPQFMGYFATRKYHYPGTPATNESNRNLLLFRDPSVDGLMTGRTDAAGYCMVATAIRNFPNLQRSDTQNGVPTGRRLLAIVLGAESDNARANESQKLLNWGYTAFEAVKLFDANQSVVAPALWKGTASKVELGQYQPIVVAVPTGSASKLKTQVLRNEPLLAPVTKGQPLATLRVTAGEQVIVDLPLLALDGVDQAGLFGRAWDAVRLWIR